MVRILAAYFGLDTLLVRALTRWKSADHQLQTANPLKSITTVQILGPTLAGTNLPVGGSFLLLLY